MPETTVLSVARPLIGKFSITPFEGQVWTLSRRSCNLIDANNRVVMLVAPEFGRGPFSVVLNTPDFFMPLACNQPVWIDRHSLTIGNRQISLEKAAIWEPILPRPLLSRAAVRSVAAVWHTYADWPHLNRLSPTEKIIVRIVQKAANEFQQAIVHNHSLEPAVARLAGLGLGLTPTGDDYLVGAMAALWLAGHEELITQIERIAAPRTTVLSAAFLKAAAQGEFLESWHELSQALAAKDSSKLAAAAHHVTWLGASSGSDAMAGFSATILSLVMEPAGQCPAGLKEI